jgi:zinc transport system substrate-binding protein
MKTSKLIPILLSAAVLAGLFAGCAKPEDDGRLKVVCTLFPQYDFVRAIAGDKVNAELLLEPGEEPHSYMPDSKTLTGIADCDLFIYANDYAEPWVAEKLGAIKRKQAYVLNASKGIIFEMNLSHDDHSHDEGETHEHTYEPHAWILPENAAIMVDNIAAELIRMDSENAALYQANTAAYKAKLTELDEGFRDAVQNGKRKIIIMGDRFNLQYFVMEYGLAYLAALSSCSESSEPDDVVTAKLIDAVKTQGIPAVFYRELSDKNTAQKISAATGAQLLLFHTYSNLSAQEAADGATFLSLMGGNLENLRVALG